MISNSLFGVKPLEILSKKKDLLAMFNDLLSDREKDRALKDSHSKRPPRWCGITVHVTINCPFACSYCYIEDMGFKFDDIKPYPLSGKELVYALLSNKTFLPGRTGTLIAIGAISEPFIFEYKIIEYLKWLGELGNPVQFSTKQYISSSLAHRIAQISSENNLPISPLVTIITFKYYRELERYAPSPEKRLSSIKNLRDVGLYPVLFLRPVIPGVNVNEIKDIIKAISAINECQFHIHGMFIFGLDKDTPTVIDNTVKFALKHKIGSVQFAILTPLPGTPVYEEMCKNKRILSHNWSLYDGLHIVFSPKNFSPYALQKAVIKAHKTFYSLKNTFKRLLDRKFLSAQISLYALKLTYEWQRKNKEFLNWLKELDIKSMLIEEV